MAFAVWGTGLYKRNVSSSEEFFLSILSWKAPGSSENSHFALKASLDMLGSAHGSYFNQQSLARSDFVCHARGVFKGAGHQNYTKPPVGCLNGHKCGCGFYPMGAQVLFQLKCEVCYFNIAFFSPSLYSHF